MLAAGTTAQSTGSGVTEPPAAPAVGGLLLVTYEGGVDRPVGEMVGRLVAEDGCLTLIDGTMSYPLVWPMGTVLSHLSGTAVVTSPDGATGEVGADGRFGGGYLSEGILANLTITGPVQDCVAGSGDICLHLLGGRGVDEQDSDTGDRCDLE